MKIRTAILVLTIAWVSLGLSTDGHAVGMGFGARVGQMFNYDNPQLEMQGIEPKDLRMFGVHMTMFSFGMVNIEVSGEYAKDEFTRNILEPLGVASVDASITVRDYGFYATGRYKIVQGTWGAHIGGGLNVHRATYSVDLPIDVPWFDEAVEIPGNGWHTGIHALAGVSFGPPMSPLRVFGEIRIAKISIDGEAGQQAIVLAGITFGSF